MPRKVQKVVDFQSHCPIFRVGTRIPSIYCVLWSKRDLRCLGPFLFFSRERELFHVILHHIMLPTLWTFFSEGFSSQRMDSDSLRDVENHLYPQAQVPSFYVLNFSPASIDTVPASPVHSCPALSIWGDVSLFISFAMPKSSYPHLYHSSQRGHHCSGKMSPGQDT